MNEYLNIRDSLSKRVVSFPDGSCVPVLGQGTWNMGEKQSLKEEEVKALRLGIELGMTLIDTAEMYVRRGNSRDTRSGFSRLQGLSS